MRVIWEEQDIIPGTVVCFNSSNRKRWIIGYAIPTETSAEPEICTDAKQWKKHLIEFAGKPEMYAFVRTEENIVSSLMTKDEIMAYLSEKRLMPYGVQANLPTVVNALNTKISDIANGPAE